ncbi:MAG: hypothetical protein OXN86_07695 [Chloroflexota bacterium]|nr:hypothetical protein [Chloroflexota bacterium]
MQLTTTGGFYEQFVIKSDKYDVALQECIESTVAKLRANETSAGRPGMLLGKIQSGKTRTFLGIIALAFENDFDIAVILTKGTNALAKQTLARVRDEFAPLTAQDGAQIHDIMTVPSGLTGYELSQKLVFIAKKQVHNLDKLSALIGQEYSELANKKALIIDDEADYASIGFKTTPNSGLQANVATQKIDALRGLFESSAFLQVTATPYALYLQPDDLADSDFEYRPLRPAFTELVPVPKSYIGSEFYFDDSQNEESVASFLFREVSPEELLVLKQSDRRRFKIEDCLTSNANASIRSAICTFIVGGVIRRMQNARAGQVPGKFSFLVHTESARQSHAWQESVVMAIKERLAEAADGGLPILNELMGTAYDDLANSIALMAHDLPPKQEVLEKATKALKDDWLMVTKVNSDAQVEELLDDQGQLRLRTPLNLFVGGQILDRGITVAHLIGFFYGRRPNVFQQDTVLQHSRMFGFRPIQDLAVTRFYTARAIYDAMSRMHESDIALRDEIQRNAESPVVFIQRDPAGKVVPCSPNKILISSTTTLKPNKRLLPVGFQTDYAVRTKPAVAQIDALVDEVFGADLEEPVEVPLSLAVDILGLIAPTIRMEEDRGYEFDWDGATAALEYLSNTARGQHNRGKVLLLVRKDRNLSRRLKSQTRGEFSDAPDTAQREGVIARRRAIDMPMLMLFRQNGSEELGWRGTPFYWPVVWVPKNARTTVYSHATQ